jgi:hypothetical protein
MSQHKGTCFCGKVAFTVEGAPAGMGYCHCNDCRVWAAAPINAFSLWAPEAVRVTQGQEQIGVYNKTPNSLRKFCKNCGGHLMTEHPQWKLIDVYAGVIPSFPFKAGVHVHYKDTVLPMKDGLPKMRDLPKEMGGSGETLPE